MADNTGKADAAADAGAQGNPAVENDTFEDATEDTNEAEKSAPAPPPLGHRTLTDRSSMSLQSITDSPDSRPQSHGNDSIIAGPPINMTDNVQEQHPRPGSPLLTTHRSSAEHDDLEETPRPPPKTKRISQQMHDRDPSPSSKPSLPSRSSATAKSTLHGLSGVLPSVPWGPPPAAPANHVPPPPAPAPTSATRKLTSPFAWLSRNTVTTREPPLPPIPSTSHRRDTASTIASIGSNPELMVSKLEEVNESDGTRGSGRNSLKDRFKQLRMREEVGVVLPDEDKNAEIASPTLDVQHASKRNTPPASPILPANPALAPGTAAGVSAGPPASDGPAMTVDWDLWQSVVYEGPAAVARTSAERLNRAIAAGIPHAIRGVVWQVLAQSKNDELEQVYRELLNRGTDKERDRHSGSSAAPSLSNASIGGSGRDRDTIKSSASSIHSDHSTPATTVTNGVRSPSPPTEREIEALAKAHATTSAAERKKKAKEDAAALSKLEKAIRRDLGARTSYSKYAASAGLQEGLFGVCKAYALFDEGVGYAQGMNFLAMPLLFNMPEEEAFCMLVRLMSNYRLRDLFVGDMPGLHMHLYQFERLLEDFEPALYCHLRRKQVTPVLYATQWFLTLFAYRFPLQLVLRIYDLILSEGLEAILKFGIVLMQRNAVALLELQDMVALTTFLKDRLFDVYIDAAPSAGSILESGFFGSSGASIDKEVYRADRLIQDACAVKITPETLKLYTSEWEEKTRLEKEREATLESLRSANTTLTTKIRTLEERVSAHDAEHAALATELVRTKVINEELSDANESMRVQVAELRHVVDTQPGEVEARLQEEMGRIRKRNEEVHGANRRIEEELGGMERDLVETKMAHAELNANHETLQRKWAELRKALNEQDS